MVQWGGGSDQIEALERALTEKSAFDSWRRAWDEWS